MRSVSSSSTASDFPCARPSMMYSVMKKKKSSAVRRGSVPIASHVMTPIYTGQLRVFDIYTFLETKGAGAFGKVMEVEHKVIRSTRACKVISLRNPRQMKQVDSEMAFMRKLDHPNVLRLFESYYDGDRSIYLIIELCSGGTLKDRVDRFCSLGQVMPELQAGRAMSDLLSAVSYCNRCGVVHRDIKTENVLYVDSTDASRLKVIDFGLSEFLGDGRTESRIGTPHYMAPEIYNERVYDAKTDAFACGTVLAEILTGIHPFFTLGQDNLESIRVNIVTGRIDFASPAWRRVSADAMDLVQRLLATDRQERIDAGAALQDTWLVSVRQILRSGKGVDASVFAALNKFRDSNVLKQAAARVLAKQLDNSLLADLQQQFDQLDVDGSGTLSCQELVSAGRRCGVNMDPAEMRELLVVFDKLNPCGISSGEIHCNDFVASMLGAHITPTRQQLDYVFCRFADKDTHKITAGSLIRALTALGGVESVRSRRPQADVTLVEIPPTNSGEDVTEDDMEQVFDEICYGRRVVSFADFCSMWEDVPPKPLIALPRPSMTEFE